MTPIQGYVVNKVSDETTRASRRRANRVTHSSRKLGLESLERRVVLANAIPVPALIGPKLDVNSPGPGTNGIGTHVAGLRATVAGTVFLDANADGTRQDGEPGRPGVTVLLTDGSGTVVGTAVTDANGSYSFANVPLGDYTLTESTPAGYGVSNPATRSITVPQAGLTGQDFGETTGSLAGVVYLDGNDDGQDQPTETRLADVTVTLTGTDVNAMAVTATTTTAADGSFQFTGLLAGTYTVAETRPSGLLAGTDATGNQGGTAGVDQVAGIGLGAGVNGTGYLLANLTPASIAGTVYTDTNDDGTEQPGEAGVAGVAVTLTGRDDQGQAVQATGTTTADGSYLFTDLRPGTYAVEATTPADDLTGKASPGNLGGSAGVGRISGVTLAAGAASAGNDFGILSPASLGGTVYRDANDNGSRQANEPGFAGVTVTLTGLDDLAQPVSTTLTTGTDGAYDFTNLRPGTYAVTETPPPATLVGVVNDGSAGGVVAGQQIAGVVLVSGQGSTGNNFAALRPGSLSGFVYDDANDDGGKGATEAGIGGVAVTLTGTNDKGQAVGATQTTGADGSYDFAGLRPGQYSLASVTPTGMFTGKTTAGTTGGLTGPNLIAAIDLNEGVDGTANNFAAVEPASLTGSVFVDLDNNGIREAGESGLGGVTLVLTGTDDTGAPVRLSTTTVADGAYAFAGSRPGVYTVTETPPVGYANGKDAAGTAGGTVGVDTIGSITLAPGTLANGYTFAELGTTVAGTVFLDLGGNGADQPGDPGVPDAEVTLHDGSGQVIGSTTTGPTGSYSFPGVPAGSYQVVVNYPNPDGTRTTTTLPVQVQAGVPVTESTPVTPPVSPAPVTPVTPPVSPAPVTPVTPVVPATPATGTVSGTVFNDTNDDGVRQPTETGVAGVILTLIGTDSTGQSVALVTSTGLDGSYAFANVTAGTYTVSVATPAGDLFNKASPTTVTAPLEAGQAGNLSFGVLPPASLAGVVYLDANKNGRDDNEFGIAHVNVTLNGVNDLGQTVQAATATDADGQYQFNDLRPGSYTIDRGSAALFTSGGITVGTLGGAVNPPTVGPIPVMGGEAGQNYNFGELTRLSCVLNDPAIRAVVVLGPHPVGPVTPLGGASHPHIEYYLPRLAAEIEGPVAAAQTSRSHKTASSTHAQATTTHVKAASVHPAGPRSHQTRPRPTPHRVGH